jgi:acyl-CoA synthetase (AMP-forming)/AMP-acid ligase II/acyl carrier protein
MDNLINTIPNIIRHHRGMKPGAPALHALDESAMPFADLAELCSSSASVLAAMDLGAGDSIAIVLPNGPIMATTFLAVTHLATAAPLNPGLKEAEFAFYLEDLQARAVIVMEPDVTQASAAAESLGISIIRIRPAAGGPAGLFSFDIERDIPSAPVSDVRSNATALVLHTSGTTAKPKIVPLTHENLCRSAASVAESLELVPGDKCLNVMPLFHIHGLVAALLASLYRGASVICTPGYRAPEFFPWIRQTSPTWYTAVPTMHQAVLARASREDPDFVLNSGLRFIRSSSASLPLSVLRQLESAFDVPVIEAYGMTEAAHQMASNPLPPGKRKPGSVGIAAGPEVAIADESGRFLAEEQIGEVVIRGRNVTDGYHGLSDQSAYFFGDHWFRTGDQGYLDSDGYLFLTGRLKEIINRGGETIAPKEIDEALLEHTNVLQAVAFSVPDVDLGEEVAAAVVLADGAGETETDLQMFLEERLSWARMPKRILILDEIPKGATGKLQRIGLAETLGIETVRQAPKSSAADTGEIITGDAAGTLEALAGFWRDILKLPEIGPDEPFLEAGGDSLTAMTLVMRVEQEFSIKVPLMAFFDAATIRLQAELIDRMIKESG